MTALPRGFERRLPIDKDAPCLPWQGTTVPHGYGQLTVDGQPKYAHRLAYQLHVGPIPRGWEIDHVCHSAAVAAGRCDGGACPHRACIQPAHLELVSSRENSMRGNHPLFAIARGTHCRRGHDLSLPENVTLKSNGKRRCKRCDLDAQQRRRDASKRSQ